MSDGKNGGSLLRKGSRGDEVKDLQNNLTKLGFDVKADSIFGAETENAVLQLQKMFGYTVDGLVGDGTKRLITAQLGYGWNAKSPDAAAKALQAQGKSVSAADMDAAMASKASKAVPNTGANAPAKKG